MYKIFVVKEVEKRCKKQGKAFKVEISKILLKLQVNPFLPQAEQLSGQLNFIYSYHFNFSGTSYRLCYTVNKQEKLITIILVGPRENFYKILKQKLS